MSELRRVDLGEVPYDESGTVMTGWADERRDGRAPDRLFLLSHPPVITYGRLTPPGELPGLDAIPVVPVDRGGHATYHGPGQLVGYLIVSLRERQRGPVDIIRFVENALIEAVGKLGVEAVRRETPKGAPSLVGVWTPEHRKLASIGMRIRGGITTHGFALNVDPDLSPFDTFIACGLADVEMTSLQRAADAHGLATPTFDEVKDAVATAFGAS
ncbi:lipoyl(octanoyl) transferase LipB [Catenuloplanes japonicus]|uniref:lipoyl(octanoyl) transferase LipB n=1 Tax=Catenuloplanes japonicus TaxID=33876 RepID=UPI000527027E|nr:lipoyl(octanoyl) transferase LipB [Catenuloplanes japonicus]